jgi:surface protein
MKSLITKLALYLKKGDKLKAESTEEELFFSLSTNEIVKIIQKSGISNAVINSKIISRMYKVKGEEAALILNVVESKEATFEECVQIVSSLKCSPICVRLGDLYAEDKKQPEPDYEHEISNLEQEIEKLKQKETETDIKMKGQLIYDKINEEFKRKNNIKPEDVWYPDFSKKDITDMSEMFQSADLNGLDLSHWNTSNVTNMDHMFDY